MTENCTTICPFAPLNYRAPKPRVGVTGPRWPCPKPLIFWQAFILPVSCLIPAWCALPDLCLISASCQEQAHG